MTRADQIVKELIEDDDDFNWKDVVEPEAGHGFNPKLGLSLDQLGFKHGATGLARTPSRWRLYPLQPAPHSISIRVYTRASGQAVVYVQTDQGEITHTLIDDPEAPALVNFIYQADQTLSEAETFEAAMRHMGLLRVERRCAVPESTEDDFDMKEILADEPWDVTEKNVQFDDTVLIYVARLASHPELSFRLFRTNPGAYVARCYMPGWAHGFGIGADNDEEALAMGKKEAIRYFQSKGALLSESDEDFDWKDVVSGNRLRLPVRFGDLPDGVPFQMHHGDQAVKSNGMIIVNGVTRDLNNPDYVCYPVDWSLATIKSFGRSSKGSTGCPQAQFMEAEDDFDTKDLELSVEEVDLLAATEIADRLNRAGLKFTIDKNLHAMLDDRMHGREVRLGPDAQFILEPRVYNEVSQKYQIKLWTRIPWIPDYGDYYTIWKNHLQRVVGMQNTVWLFGNHAVEVLVPVGATTQIEVVERLAKKIHESQPVDRERLKIVYEKIYKLAEAHGQESEDDFDTKDLETSSDESLIVGHATEGQSPHDLALRVSMYGWQNPELSEPGPDNPSWEVRFNYPRGAIPDNDPAQVDQAAWHVIELAAAMSFRGHVRVTRVQDANYDFVFRVEPLVQESDEDDFEAKDLESDAPYKLGSYWIIKSGDHGVYGNEPFRYDYLAYSSNSDGTKDFEGYLRKQPNGRWVAALIADPKARRGADYMFQFSPEFDWQLEAVDYLMKWKRGELGEAVAKKDHSVLVVHRADGRCVLQWDNGKWTAIDHNQGQGYSPEEAVVKAREIKARLDAGEVVESLAEAVVQPDATTLNQIVDYALEAIRSASQEASASGGAEERSYAWKQAFKQALEARSNEQVKLKGYPPATGGYESSHGTGGYSFANKSLVLGVPYAWARGPGSTLDDSTVRHRIMQIVGHELVHAGQHQRVPPEVPQDRVSGHYRKYPGVPLDMAAYADAPGEIMAGAYQHVRELVNRGYTKRQVLDFLNQSKRGNDTVYQYRQREQAMRPETKARFLKYAYQYAQSLPESLEGDDFDWKDVVIQVPGNYRVELVPNAPSLLDVYVEDKWTCRLSRRETRNIDGSSRVTYSMNWFPEHPAHPQPLFFNSIEDAAIWVTDHRSIYNGNESEKDENAHLYPARESLEDDFETKDLEAEPSDLWQEVAVERGDRPIFIYERPLRKQVLRLKVMKMAEGTYEVYFYSDYHGLLGGDMVDATSDAEAIAISKNLANDFFRSQDYLQPFTEAKTVVEALINGDDDDVDVKDLAQDFSPPALIRSALEEEGWHHVCCNLIDPDRKIYLLEWDSPKHLTNGTPQAEFDAEADRAEAAAKSVVDRSWPGVQYHEFLAPAFDSDFSLSFIPPQATPLVRESLDDDVDMKELGYPLPDTALELLKQLGFKCTYYHHYSYYDGSREIQADLSENGLGWHITIYPTGDKSEVYIGDEKQAVALLKHLFQGTESLAQMESRERETRQYKVTADPEHLDQIEELFWWMNSTQSGHSGSAKIYVDGDGAARVDIEKEDGELKKPEEEVHSRCDGEAEFSVCLESLKATVQSDDGQLKVEFDAGPWFQAATVDQVKAVMECADAVALDQRGNPDLDRFFGQVSGGFKVYVDSQAVARARPDAVKGQ